MTTVPARLAEVCASTRPEPGIVGMCRRLPVLHPMRDVSADEPAPTAARGES